MFVPRLHHRYTDYFRPCHLHFSMVKISTILKQKRYGLRLKIFSHLFKFSITPACPGFYNICCEISFSQRVLPPFPTIAALHPVRQNSFGHEHFKISLLLAVAVPVLLPLFISLESIFVAAQQDKRPCF